MRTALALALAAAFAAGAFLAGTAYERSQQVTICGAYTQLWELAGDRGCELLDGYTAVPDPKLAA